MTSWVSIFECLVCRCYFSEMVCIFGKLIHNQVDHALDFKIFKGAVGMI